MDRIKCITELSPKDVNERIVVKCVDEAGRDTILIKSSSNAKTKNTDTTNELIFITDMELAIVGDPEKHYFFHSLTCKNKDLESEEAFATAFRFLEDKCLAPISKEEAGSLFESLKMLFRAGSQRTDEALQTGIFGELLSIWRLNALGVKDIFKKYHKDFFLKHDIELTSAKRIEIKSTTSSIRSHVFSHSQIYRKDCQVAVISVLLEKAEEGGTTLFDLFVMVEKEINDPETILGLEVIRKQCGVSKENKGVVFSLEYAKQNIGFYWAKDLPKFECAEPAGVTNTQYLVDFARTKQIPPEDFVDWCNGA
jgi:hypothetical protein